MRKCVLLLFMAYASALGDDDTCVEKEFEKCYDGYFSLYFNDTISQKKFCSARNSVLQCIRNTVEKCPGKATQDLVKQDVENFGMMFQKHCWDVDRLFGEDEIQKCLQDNNEYIEACVIDRTKKLEDFLKKHKLELSKKAVSCEHFYDINFCSADRIQEKCGFEAARALHKETPEEIRSACTETKKERDDFKSISRGIIGAVNDISLALSNEGCVVNALVPCWDAFYSLRFNATVTQKELCSAKYRVLQCMRDAGDKCPGKASQDVVKSNIEKFSGLFHEECWDVDREFGEEDIKKCLQDNKEYFKDCVIDNTRKLEDILKKKKLVLSEKAVSCRLHYPTKFCIEKRIQATCGFKAGRDFRNETLRASEEIRTACKETWEELKELRNKRRRLATGGT